jgi:hypothetical protein
MGDGHLPLEGNSAVGKFHRERALVHRLDEPRSNLAVHDERSIHHLTDNVFGLG